MNCKNLNPRLTFWEWLWTIYAIACFWNKNYRWPYARLSERKATILETIREEALEIKCFRDNRATFSCGHSECGKPGPALEDFHSLADWEEAVLFHAYTRQTHWDEVDHPALLQEEMADRYEENERRYLEEQQEQEIRDEIAKDRELDALFIAEWQEAIAFPEPRTAEQNKRIEFAEKWFGGQDKLLENMERLKKIALET